MTCKKLKIKKKQQKLGNLESHTNGRRMEKLAGALYRALLTVKNSTLENNNNKAICKASAERISQLTSNATRDNSLIKLAIYVWLCVCAYVCVCWTKVLDIKEIMCR